MFDLFALILALAVPFLIGWALIKIFFPCSIYDRPALAFGLGAGLMTLIMFYFSLMRINVIPAVVILAAVLLLALSRLLYRRREVAANNAVKVVKEPALRGFEKFILAGVALSFFLLMARTVGGVWDIWDSWSVWGFKAKIYFVDQGIPFEKFGAFYRAWGCWDYPHHLPLLESWVMSVLGSWDDKLPKVLFPLFWLGIAWVVYAYMRETSGRNKGIMAMFMVSAIPGLQLWTSACIAEPLVVFYYIASLLYLLRWLQSRRASCFYLSAALAGLAAWTKNEGVMYALFNVLVLLIGSSSRGVRRWYEGGWYLLVAFCLLWPWWLFVKMMRFENVLINGANLSVSALAERTAYIPEVLGALAGHMLKIKFYGVSWVMLALVFPLKLVCEFGSQTKLILMAIGMHLILVIALGVIGDGLYQIDAMERLLLAPSVLAVIAFFTLRDKEEAKAPAGGLSA